MGTTSEKLTYLNTTKEKIRDSINLTGTNIGTSDTFRSYASKLKKGYIDIINNGIDNLYNNFPKVSGIGSNLSLTPTYEAPMKLNEIQGDTLQDNSPTPDSPVPIESVTGLQNVEVCGKNLFNSSVISSPKITISEDGTLNVSDIGSANGYCETGKTLGQLCPNLKVGDIVYLYIDTDFYYSGSKRDLIYCRGNWTNGTSKTITQDMLNGIVVVYGGYEETSHIKIMISKQLETPYEPYTGTTYEVNLGKNLFNTLNRNILWNSILVSSTNNELVLKPNLNAGGYVQYQVNNIKPDTKYTISCNIDLEGVTTNYKGTIYVYEYNANGTQHNITSLNNENLKRTFTTQSDTTHLRFSFYGLNGSDDNWENIQVTYSNIQLEQGGTQTSFSPYFTPIELNKIGDYEDRIYKDNGKWYVEKQIGKIVLDGSENWSYNDVNQVFIVPDLVNYLRSGFIPYSNYYQGQSVTLYNQVENNHIAFLQSTTQSRLLIKNLNYTGVDAFKTWLSTHNIEVLYVLATPTYTEITNTELIEDLETLYTAKSQEGTTNISITSEDLEMILNVSALKSE